MTKPITVFAILSIKPKKTVKFHFSSAHTAVTKS